jgi:S-adenosylmethionine synthetase
MAHAGKIYSVLSHQLAHRIHASTTGLAEAYVHLVARIGEPIDRPWVGIQLVLEPGAAIGDVEGAVRATLEVRLEHLSDFRARLGRGEFSIY